MDNNIKTKDFYYDLPEGLIAQHPMESREMSRLLEEKDQGGGLAE